MLECRVYSANARLQNCTTGALHSSTSMTLKRKELTYVLFHSMGWMLNQRNRSPTLKLPLTVHASRYSAMAMTMTIPANGKASSAALSAPSNTEASGGSGSIYSAVCSTHRRENTAETTPTTSFPMGTSGLYSCCFSWLYLRSVTSFSSTYTAILNLLSVVWSLASSLLLASHPRFFWSSFRPSRSRRRTSPISTRSAVRERTLSCASANSRASMWRGR
mmetsp:Transcript_42372/g.83240  ORF Transcript_42372/g.83240 Transcript_42372/m.83240 type:complete len:219 (-) Transcript_42372:941-1597(-)